MLPVTDSLAWGEAKANSGWLGNMNASWKGPEWPKIGTRPTQEQWYHTKYNEEAQKQGLQESGIER